MFALILNLSLMLSAGASPLPAQNELPRGQVIERVTCVQDPKQTYALYLPSNYSETRHWPILYAFDPAARGKVPVERYREAAERFGEQAGRLRSSRGRLPPHSKLRR